MELDRWCFNSSSCKRCYIKAADVAGDSNIMTISANVSTDTYVTYLAGTSTYAELETAAASAMGATGAVDAATVVLVAIDDGTHTGPLAVYVW